MRKSKNVFIIVLTFVLVCVIGYALFSNQLTINGTVSAKGEFEFTATCEPGLSSEVPENLEKIIDDVNNIFGSDYPIVES